MPARDGASRSPALQMGELTWKRRRKVAGGTKFAHRLTEMGVILDYLGARVTPGGPSKGQGGRKWTREKAVCHRGGLISLGLKMGDWTPSQGMQQASRSWKTQLLEASRKFWTPRPFRKEHGPGHKWL